MSVAGGGGRHEGPCGTMRGRGTGGLRINGIVSPQGIISSLVMSGLVRCAQANKSDSGVASFPKGQDPSPAIPADVMEHGNPMAQADAAWLLFIFSTLCVPLQSLKAGAIIPYATPPSVTTKESPAEHSGSFIQMIDCVTRALSLLITFQQRNASEEVMGWVQTGTLSTSNHFLLPSFEERGCAGSALQRLWLRTAKVQQVTAAETLTKDGERSGIHQPLDF